MEGKRGVLLSCMSQHCNFFDIVRTAGLKPMMLSAEYDPNWKANDKVLDEFYARRSLMLFYDAEIRHQNMTMMLNAVNLKPYQRCKRSRSTFDILVEKAYQ